MNLDGARVLVCGASGVLGGELAERLTTRRARVAVAGRSEHRLSDLSDRLGGLPALTFDAVDLDSCRRVVHEAVDALGGLDGLVVATGVAAFGPAMDADDAITEELFSVNVLGPMALVRAAGNHLVHGGTVAVLSAVLADVPTAGMAEYSASKSALSSWLTVLRREQRGRVNVLDVRPPHLDTGLAERPLAGTAPPLPEPFPAGQVADAVISAIQDDAREVAFDFKRRELTVR
jgi:short-subunit dehydrogenase